MACETLPDLSNNPFEADLDEQIPEIYEIMKSTNGSSIDINWLANDFALEWFTTVHGLPLANIPISILFSINTHLKFCFDILIDIVCENFVFEQLFFN